MALDKLTRNVSAVELRAFELSTVPEDNELRLKATVSASVGLLEAAVYEIMSA